MKKIFMVHGLLFPSCFCFHRGKIPKWILSIKISSFISFSARRNVMHMQRFDSWPDSTNAREVSSCWLLFALPPPATHFLPVLSVTRRASHVVLLLLFFHRSISLLFLPMPCVSKTRAISDAYKNKRCIAYCSFRFSPLNSSQINRVFFLLSLSLSGMASSLLSGERVVVLLYISRVFFSAPSSLYLESIALLLLALAGLFVEISAENSSALDRFKTRSDPFPLLPFSKTLACSRNSTVYLSKFQSVRVSGHESSSSSFVSYLLILRTLRSDPDAILSVAVYFVEEMVGWVIALWKFLLDFWYVILVCRIV